MKPIPRRVNNSRMEKWKEETKVRIEERSNRKRRRKRGGAEEEIEKYKIITKKGGEQGKVFRPVMEVEVRYRTRHGNGETLSVGAEERLES